MKNLLLLFVLVISVSCGSADSDSGSDLPDGAGENFGRCVSDEEATSLGLSVQCGAAPKCVCVEDVHSGEPRLYAHCHSAASKCD